MVSINRVIKVTSEHPLQGDSALPDTYPYIKPYISFLKATRCFNIL